MRAIIPCAGFGTRVGMKSNESKELLLDSNNKPLIQYSLDICKLYQIDPLVMLREEKKDLQEYLKKEKVNYIIVKPEGEWYDTVLMSQGHWDENNILMLPDTKFDIDCIKDIVSGLELGNNAVFAMHYVEDPENWGVIYKYKMYEKSKELTRPQMAWGLIAFKCDYGKILFQNMRYGNMQLQNCGFTYLDHFEDVTRSKK